MVDKRRLVQELRELKERLRNDPEVRAMYDLDGDGQISGEEWDLARKAVIAQLEAEQARAVADPAALEKVAGREQLEAAGTGAARRVHGRIAAGSDLPAGHPFLEPALVIRQLETRTELFFNVESTNAYRIMTPGGQEVGYAAETETGLLGTVTRNLLGTARSFVMGIRLHTTPNDMWIKRHFTLLFSRLQVADGPDVVGQVRRRFSLLRRRYDLEPYYGGHRVLRIVGPIFKPWTFNVMDGERQVGSIKKKWSGLFREAFTREDHFTIAFEDPSLSGVHRMLIVAAAISIDMDHFERRKN